MERRNSINAVNLRSIHSQITVDCIPISELLQL